MSFLDGEPGEHLRILQDALRGLDFSMSGFNKRLKYEVDLQSYELTVKVIDRETDNVIKVLPPEELQRLFSKIGDSLEYLPGDLVDRRI
jgi:flagellar protein FlaG